MYTEIEWTCTDPDTHQYGRKIKDGHYQFREFDRFNYYINTDEYPSEDVFIDTVWDNDEFWVEEDIILSHYTDGEVRNHVSAYYESMEQLRKYYDEEEAEWIIAEIIFEQESGLY